MVRGKFMTVGISNVQQWQTCDRSADRRLTCLRSTLRPSPTNAFRTFLISLQNANDRPRLHLPVDCPSPKTINWPGNYEPDFAIHRWHRVPGDNIASRRDESQCRMRLDCHHSSEARFCRAVTGKRSSDHAGSDNLQRDCGQVISGRRKLASWVEF
jgi:hypothetical protein